MSLFSRLLARFFRLPLADTYDIVVDKDVPVPMSDGVTLRADHYYPRQGAPPVILMRTPYGRSNFAHNGRLFAERGFQVLIQSCRGTDGSGGRFNPIYQEHADGLDTLQWIRKQGWFSGKLATYGPSYLGYAQWAIAAEAGPELQAMVSQVAPPDIRRQLFPGGSLSIDTLIRWAGLTEKLSLSRYLRVNLNADRAARHLPLREADIVIADKPIPFFREWLDHHAPEDPWWAPQNFWGSVPQVAAPVFLFDGWYDIFCPDTIQLYQTLRQAGRQPSMIIGPWAHTSREISQYDMKEALAWFQAYLLGDRRGLRELPVRLYVMGADEWRDYPDWPPAGFRPQRWHLQGGRGLALAAPAESAPDIYRYDPADPTPAVGGIGFTTNFGSQDQRKLEARPDVLTYTGPVLDRDLEVIGPVQVELYLRSSRAHTDFFACLCDVDLAGKSRNVTSALRRIWPGHPESGVDGIVRLGIELYPTAHCFRRGHRLRLQVSSGAFPHYARNLGSGEPLATGTTLCVADQTVYHDPAHPSVIILPALER